MQYDVLVSVVIPMYNREAFIREAIDSVLKQSFQQFEIIVLDDCSTDNSCAEVEAIDDSRIILYYAKEKSGISKLRNIGNNMTRGKYICVMDSDDIIPDYRLQEEFDFLEANVDVGVVGGHCKLFGLRDNMMMANYDSDTINCGHIFRTLLFHGTAMIRKSVLDEFSIQYNEESFVGEDWGLWVDMINKVKMVNLDRIFLYYRIHDNNISATSTSNKEIKAKRKDTIDRIQIRAIKNLGLVLNDEELIAFNNFYREADEDLEPPTYDNYEDIKKILKTMQTQANHLDINAEAFEKYSNEWTEKMARRHGILND